MSNDSDLVTPLRLVRQELGRAVGLVTPTEAKRASNELERTVPQFHRHVTVADVAACQLPDVLTDANGRVVRPAQWSRHSEGPDEAGPPGQWPKHLGLCRQVSTRD